MNDTLLREALAAHARGWRALIPLAGKRAIRKEWSVAPPSTDDQVRSWIEAGHDIGLRTGSLSGIFVVDVESSGSVDDFDLPVTIEAVSGSGGRHLYFRWVEGLGNTSCKLAPGVDTRGEGGYVVYPGSWHRGTGVLYAWAAGRAPGECELATLPEAVVAMLQRKLEPEASETPGSAGGRADAIWGRSAMASECQRVRASSEGRRNTTLNTASFRLGQIVGGESLSRVEVETALVQAGLDTGLEEREVRATVGSGLSAGLRAPRYPSPRRMGVAPDVFPADLPEVLVPGTHVVEGADCVQISTHTFSRDVAACLPVHAIQRRDMHVGRIQSGQFCMIGHHDVRRIVDEHVQLVAWIARTKRDVVHYVRTRPTCSADLAQLVISAARTSAPPIDLVATYPVWLGDRWSPPGYCRGVFYEPSCTPVAIEDRFDIVNVLDDLVVDFPWETEADRQTYLGLLLTPMLRPTIHGRVPLHAITSHQRGSGKTLLASTIRGIIRGKDVPIISLSGSEEEVRKILFAQLFSGETLVTIDNITRELDSSSLAALITGTAYTDRVLGSSYVPSNSIGQHLVLAVTGNDLQLSPDMARRTVHIVLRYNGGDPTMRTGFAHPDLDMYLSDARPVVIGAIQGAVSLWLRAGSPMWPGVYGGFERWAGIVGGVMRCLGYDQWLARRERLSAESDAERADVAILVERWIRVFGGEPKNPGSLVCLLEDDILPEVLKIGRDHGRAIKLGRILKSYSMSKHTFDDWMIETYASSSKGNTFRLTRS